MDAIFESLPIYMMIGIIVVIGVSQVHRLYGAILSVVFWTIVAAVGMHGYNQGHTVGLPGMQFPRFVFLAICIAFAALHGAAGWAYLQRNKRRRHRAMMDQEED